jgi:acyl carrier protein
VLEYLGRTDHQIKIRGFRIELGEIEACLESNESVRHAAVVVQKDPRGDDSLVAFYQMQIDTKEELTDALKSSIEASIIVTLKESLPVYMQPTLLINLSHMPLNANGKIDRRSLPLADFDKATHKNAAKKHTTPRNETEKTLVTLWQDVLKIQDVDIHASFFELGGHSLLAAQLHARVCQRFVIDLPLRTLFEHNSVAQVAEQVELVLAAKTLASSAATNIEEDMEEFEI